MPTDTEKRIKELLTLLKKDGANLIGSDGKPLSQTVKELEQEVSNLKQENAALKQGDFLTLEKLKEIFGEKNFDEKDKFKGGTSTSDNQQPAPSPQPNKPDQTTKPVDPTDPWFATGLSGSILTNAKNNYQISDIVGGKYQNIQLVTGDNIEKTNIINWRKAFANDISPYNGYNLGDIDSNGQYKGRNIDGKTKSQIDTEIANEQKKKEETAKAQKLLAQINSETDETKLPSEDTIRKTYEETLLDNEFKYDQVIKVCKDKSITILKGKELTKYNLLKGDISNVNLNTFILLPLNFKETDIANLNNDLLPDGQKKETLTQLIKDRRATFKWKIGVEANEVQGDGMKEADYQEANKKRKNEWEVETRGKLDADTFNQFLKDNGVDLPTDQPQVTKDITAELKSKEIGGYDTNDETAEETQMTWGDDKWITQEITVEVKEIGKDPVTVTVKPKEKLDGKTLYAIEESWDIKGKGALLLPYAYKRADWNPDAPTFCQFREVPLKSGKGTVKVVNDTTLDSAKRKEIFGNETAIPGHVPLVTGGGKTTKMICDLTDGGKQNVILVCPDKGLAYSGFKNHEGWLQNYGCPNHKLNPKEVTEDFVEADENGNEKIIQKTVVRYDNHGTYQVAFNDVITQQLDLADKDADGNDIEGSEKPKWGVSVMDIDHFRGFITRNVFTTKQEDTSFQDTKTKQPLSVVGVSWLDSGKEKKFTKMGEGEIQPEISAKEIQEIKKKKIPANTIIIFDEAHLSRPDDYPELIKDTVTMTNEKGESMFKVIKMSATFKGKPFSITTTFPRTNLYMNYVGQDFNNDLSNGLTQIFLKDVNNVNVSALTAKNIPHLIVNSTNEANYESITYGMPNGGLVIVDNNRQEGYTPRIDNVFCSGWTQTPILGASWQYEVPDKTRISLSSNVQQGGRVSRKWKGKWVNLFPLSELQEAQINEKNLPIAVKITRDLLTGTKKFTKDTQVLRACFAFPGDCNDESLNPRGKFGLSPEALAMGIDGMINSAEKTIIFKFHRDMKSFPKKDEDLWKKHLGTWEPAPLDEKEAQEILKLMIQTYINTDKDFPKEVHALIKTTLIKELDWGQGKDKAPGKGEFKITPEIVEKVLHKAINEKLYELDPDLKTNPNKAEWLGIQKDIFDKIVGLFKMTNGAKCDVPSRLIDKNKPDGDKQLVIEVDYPERVTKRVMVTESEEERMLKDRIKFILEEAGLDILDEVKKVLEDDTLKRYRILAIKLRTSPLCNEVIDLIGTSRTNDLVFRLKPLENELKKLQINNELQANIEVSKE